MSNTGRADDPVGRGAGPRGRRLRGPRGARGGGDVASLGQFLPFHATPSPSKSNDDDILYYLRLRLNLQAPGIPRSRNADNQYYSERKRKR